MNELITMGAGQALGAIGGYAQRGLDSIFGIDRNKEQLEQQAALTKIQEESNRRLMKEGYALQSQMYDKTYAMNSAMAQVENLNKAGLNPALAYGMSGAGGNTATGSGSASVGGGNASDTASLKNADTNAAATCLS